MSATTSPVIEKTKRYVLDRNTESVLAVYACVHPDGLVELANVILARKTAYSMDLNVQDT